MKKIFNNLEEKFIFPIGRKSWQILSLIGLLVLVLSILYFLANSTPTSRDNVNISKSEVIDNKVDTTAAVVVSSSSCTDENYNQWVDTLKQDLPNSEWKNLGDSSDSKIEYVTDSYGNYVQDEYGNYSTITKKVFKPNPVAIPNILNDIYSKKGYDSSSICQKIEVIKMLHYLNNKIDKGYLAKEAFFYNAYFIQQSGSITLNKLEQAYALISIIESGEKIIKEQKDLISAWKYINYIVSNSVTQSQIDIVTNLIKAHKTLPTKIFPASRYFELAESVFDNNLNEVDLTTAINAFTEDISYYDNNDLFKSLKRYLKLYRDKVEIAEQKKSMKTMEKALNRTKSLTAAGAAFLSIVAVASILLLFSIQSLLKAHLGNKN